MKENQIYKCNICSNVVELVVVGAWELTCCGQAMIAIPELNHDAWEEKHVPVIEKVEQWIKVKVGSVPHPMEEDHWIQWIEVIAWDKIYRKKLNPGDAPEAEFSITDEEFIVREYCNKHWLWKA